LSIQSKSNFLVFWRTPLSLALVGPKIDPAHLVFEGTGRRDPSVSLKFLENSALIFYYVRKALALSERTQAFDQEEDIDGNR